MKSSSFFPSLGLLVILNILVKPIWIFGIDRQVQNEVGTGEFGVYFSILGLSIFFNFLLDWGLTVYYNRQLSTDPENFQHRAGGFILIKLLFALLYAVFVLAIGSMAGIERWNIIIQVVIIQILTSFFVFLRNIVTANQWFRLDAWLSVLDKSLMIILCTGFLYFPLTFGKISLSLFLDIQIICTAIAVIIISIILVKKRLSFNPTNSKLPITNSRKTYWPDRNIFKATLPYALVVLLMSAHYRADAFFLERLHPNGAYEAGLYAGAFRLLDASNMIGFLFASFLLPFIANQLSRRKPVEWIVLNSRHLLVIFSLFVGVSFIFQSDWIHDFLYTNKDERAITIMQWCLPVVISYSFVHIYGTLMTARSQLMPFCYILLVSVGVNIILNLLLIPAEGALGCCYSALISQTICGTGAMIYSHKKSGIRINLRSILIYIFIGGLLSAMYYFCRDLAVSHWLLISMAGIFTLAVSYQFKLIDLNIWKSESIKKNEQDA